MLASLKRFTGAIALAVVASGLLLVPAAPAQAASAGLIINEVYGGGGSTSTSAAYKVDFVELLNPTDSAISTNGMSLQYRSGTYTAGAVTPLPLPNAMIPAHSTYLVQTSPRVNCSGAVCGGGELPTPDFEATTIVLNLAAGSGQVILASSTNGITATGTSMHNVAEVVDFVGYGTATSSETNNTGTALTNTTSTSRTTTIDGDNNRTDFAAPATPTPTAGESEEPEPTALEATTPGNKTGMVGQAITGFSLAATGGTAPYTWTATGTPPGVDVAANGAVSGTPTTAGPYTVTATVTDSAGTPATDDVEFTFTIADAAALRTIAEIQGTGARSPFAPATGNSSGTEPVTTQGVVTARYAAGGFNGMYIQTPGADTSDASDGIFVYAGSANANIPAGIEVGDSVEVTGPIAEFNNLTQIVPASASAVTELGTSLGTVTPREIDYPATDAGRELREGELLAPTNTFTVSNSYSTNQYAEIGLASGTTPLKQMTEFVAPSDGPGVQAIKDENYARGVVLDDGATTNYLGTQATKALPTPYLTKADGSPNAIRVGGEATLESPVILDWRNNAWKFQPRTPVTTNGAEVVTFADDRAVNLVPQDVLGADGDLKVATFNVLNYFNTTGEAYVEAGPQQNPPIVTHCTFYNDRGVPAPSKRIGNDQCGVKHPGEVYPANNPNDGRGPRGAATAESLERQEIKLVNTLIALDAEVIGLEEVENSIKLPGETNRDDAVIRIVQLLNAKAGAGTWAYVKSPGESLTAAAVAEQDVIRPAFIYQTDAVEPVGQSDILFGTTEFANAREPLAQAFKAKGAPDKDAFGVIVNHFKSKSDNPSTVPPATGDNANDSATGVGAFNGDRKRQAERLVEFADDFAEDRGIEAIFLAGDFNSYTMEEPIDALELGGFELVESDQEDDESYSYQGLSGSLDHILGNGAAMDMLTGADIWEINANESPAFQYSRYNYNVTDFWQPNLPFGTSDHNPEIIGIDVPDFEPTEYKEIQVLGTNDFHGRLLPDAGNAAGAAPFATAVKELEAQNPNSVFVAAGDLVGASTFESFIQDDRPTIEALNAMGLEVSAAGNHEFDRGYEDLVDRIQGLADWEYIAANVEEPGARDDLAETWTKTIDGVKVGFVGAVTEDLPALVNPTGIQGVTVTDVVEATNAAAAELRSGDDPADLVVLLVHEGSPSTDCSSPNFTDPATTWGNIVQNTSSEVDAIISGHTHLAYNCRFPVEDWADEDRAVTRRPVVSAGQYGTNLNKLVFKYDETTDALAAISQDVIATAGVGNAPDPEVQAIVDEAVGFAEVAGAERLGSMNGPFKRASYVPQGGATENRGGESTLSNQVAEVQRWATNKAGIDTDLAFMNPGGLRADMTGTANGALQDLTYRQAADVQPFANTLVNMKLTGAQIETVLEQQWQRNAQGGVPSRPFLRLGVSKGFTYTYVESPETVSVPNSAPVSTFKGEVTGMWLNGKAIDPDATYSVTVNSFLGGGGDNFWELAEGAEKVDSGQVDLQAMVDYMDRYDTAKPLPVDYSQRGVKVTFPNSAPETYAPGATVTFDVASWSMSAAGDKVDTELRVKLGGADLGTAPVNSTVGDTPYDNTGTATVSVTLPESAADGTRRLRLVGATTGTSVLVPIQVEDGEDTTEVQVLATNDFHGRLLQDGATSAGAAVLSGAVKQMRDEYPNTVFAAAGDLIGASTFESFIQDDIPTIDALNEAGLEVSAAGNHEFDQGYEDLVGRVKDRADWEYVAANVDEPEGRDDLAKSWTRTFGDIEVGFVGAVTEELPSLVSPDGIDGIEVTDIVDAVNDEAERLKDDVGVDLVVMLVHEGSPSTDCATMENPATTWGNIVTNVSSDVNAIVSGHTHLAYNCSFPVADWSEHEVKQRPVVSAGQYGTNFNKLVFTFDDTTGELVAKDQSIVPLLGADPDGSGPGQPPALFPADPVVTEIVDAAKEVADELGAEVLGKIQGPFKRAKFSDGTTENRGGESTLGNLVAEVQRWATPAETVGAAQIAFMNPGGLRADMLGQLNQGLRELSYRQAANVQPFANTLVNMDLTGAQIETVLEQQWQRTAAGAVPTRPFLRLGVSDGFTYTYTQRDDPANNGQKLGEVTGMWLDGEAIDPDESYSVTVNSFLAAGGDNFRELANGSTKQDTGVTDLQSMVDYMGEFGRGMQQVMVDSAQRAVDVTFPDDAPASYEAGDHVVFDLASLSMTDPDDQRDTTVAVKLGDTTLAAEVPVTTTISAPTSNGSNSNDDAGTAEVDVVVPAGTRSGVRTLTVVGNNTGTLVRVPVTVTVDQVATVAAGGDVEITWGEAASIPVEVTGNDGDVTGTVRLYEGETPIGDAVTLTDGAATLPIAAKSLEPGEHPLRVAYDGNYPAASDEVVVTVAKAAPAVTAGDVSLAFGEARTVTVNVDATATGEVEVRKGATVLGTATVSNGVASVNLPARSLEPGVHELTAAYSGDDHFNAGTDALTATVAKATTTVSAADVTGTYGQPVVVAVTVADNTATGTVEVRNGGAVLGTATVSGGTASVTLPAGSLEPGVANLTAAYSGDSHVQAATDAFTATIAKVTSTVSAGDVSLVYGTAATVTVNVGPSGATGTVQVLDGPKVIGSASVSSGVATVTLSARSVEPGSNTLTAAYSGDSRFSSGSDTFTATVAKAGSTTKVKAAPGKVKLKKTRATLKITVSGQSGVVATGKVKVKVPGQGTETVTLRAGKATLKLGKFTSTGTKKVVVSYLGSDLLKPSSGTVRIKVVKK